MKKLWVVLTLTLLPAHAMADQADVGMKDRQRHYKVLETLIDAKTLSGGLTSRSFAIEVAGYKWLNVKVAYTYVTAGTITVLCDDVSSTAVKSNTHYTMTTSTTALGATTLYWDTGATTPAFAASKNFSVKVKVEGRAFVECSLTHNNTPVAGDIVTVTGELIAE